MQMRTDRIRTRHQVEQPVGDFARVEGTETNARHQTALGDLLDQCGQIDFRLKILAVAAEMDAGEDDLLVTGFGELAHLGQHFPGHHAAAQSARRRDDAVGAAVVAALLDFHEGAGVAGQRPRPHHRHAALALDIADRDLGLPLRRSLDETE